MKEGLSIFSDQLYFETKGNKATYFNIKQECVDFVKQTNVQEGILIVQSPHTTCSVFFEEMVHDFDAMGDEFLQHDLNKGLEIIFPKQLTYTTTSAETQLPDLSTVPPPL